MPSAQNCKPQARASRKHNIACAIGAFRANAIGAAPSPSSIANAAAMCPCPSKICPWCCLKTLSPMAQARRWPKCPSFTKPNAPAAAVRRGAKPTPWIPLWNPVGINSVICRPGLTAAWCRPKRRHTGSKPTNTSAASNTPFCTCSTRVSSPS